MNAQKFSEKNYEEVSEVELSEEAVKILDDIVNCSMIAYNTTMDFEWCSTDEETAKQIKLLIYNLRDLLDALEAAVRYIEDNK